MSGFGCEELLSHCGVAHRGDGASVAMQVDALADQSELVVGEALRRVWRQAGFPEQAMTSQWWRMLAKLAQSPASNGTRALNLPGAIRASRDGKSLVFECHRCG